MTLTGIDYQFNDR